MIITKVNIDQIEPAKYNPRKDLRPGDPEYESLKRSLDRWDLVEPLIWNKRNGVLVGGHQRLKILKDRGDKEVTVSVVDLDENDEKALNIALNKIQGGWDEIKLRDIFNDLSEAKFDVELTGFTLDEMDGIGGSLVPDSEETVDAEANVDKAKELQEIWGVSPGDVWELGRHRIMCGDSTSRKDVDRLFDGAKPNLMVTDPPYGVEYDPGWRKEQGLNDGGRLGKVWNDNVIDWSKAWALFPGDVAYVWHAGLYEADVVDHLVQSGFEVRSQIVWVKDNFSISRGHYHWQHEPCLYVVRDGKTAHWIGDRSQSTVWKINKNDGQNLGIHGTQKPIDCMMRPIANHASDHVYDPFCGLGTTIMACENLKRKCLAMEISPEYVAVILQRWKDATGISPVKE